MRAIATTIVLCLLTVSAPAWASHITYAPTAGSNGGFAILNGDKTGSMVVPGVNGGSTIINSNKTITTVVPSPLGGFIAQSGSGSIAAGMPNIGGVGGGGVIVDGRTFRTLAPGGSGFCAPPCAATADGVAPDGTVVTVIP